MFPSAVDLIRYRLAVIEGRSANESISPRDLVGDVVLGNSARKEKRVGSSDLPVASVDGGVGERSLAGTVEVSRAGINTDTLTSPSNHLYISSPEMTSDAIDMVNASNTSTRTTSSSSSSQYVTNQTHRGVPSLTSYNRKRLFSCSECRYSTDRKNNLKRHVTTMHTMTSKVLDCCGLKFTNKVLMLTS